MSGSILFELKSVDELREVFRSVDKSLNEAVFFRPGGFNSGGSPRLEVLCAVWNRLVGAGLAAGVLEWSEEGIRLVVV